MGKRIFAAIIILGLLAFDVSPAFAQNPVIIPGVSVGKFKLGTSRKDVLRIAPNPQENMPTHLLYKNFDTGNTLKLTLTSDRVTSICFTNQQFDTAEGIRGSNFSDQAYTYLFNHYIDKDGDNAYRYLPGGLTFWITKSSRTRFGCVYASTPSQTAQITTSTPQANPSPSTTGRMTPVLKGLIVAPWRMTERRGDRICRVQSMHSAVDQDGHLVLVTAWYENNRFLVEASLFYSEHHNGIASHIVTLDPTPGMHEFASQNASTKGIRRDNLDSAALFMVQSADQLTPPFFTTLKASSGKTLEFLVQDEGFVIAWNQCYARKS